MQRLMLTLLVFAALFGVIAPAAQAASDTYAFKGRSVYAYFSDVDDSGCIRTYVAVFASKQKVDTTTGDTDGELAVLAVSQYNTCKSEAIISGYGESFSPNLEVPKDLKTATLKDTITIQDLVSGQALAFKVDLEWESTSDKREISGDVDLALEDYTLSLTLDGKMRLAEAKGKVSLDDTDYAIGHSELAAILKINEGSLTIKS